MMIEIPSLPHAPSWRSAFFVNLSSRSVSHGYGIFRMRYNCIGIKCQISSKKDDQHYIRRCVELARKAIGHTSPNPMVGCVIVKDGEIVGEGFHQKAGLPHAEVCALKDAGGLAENSTAYVSLEPCNHHGRTPPCTDALIEAGLKKVVVGMVDPNPLVASTGLSRLSAARIEVVSGVEQELCSKLNEAYIHYIVKNTPFVILRYSVSVNGRVQAGLGGGSAGRGGYYSQLLEENDAVVLLSREPSLPESEEAGAKQPLVIVTGGDPGRMSQDPNRVVVSAAGISEGRAGADVDLGRIVGYCHGRGICSVLLDLRDESGLGMVEAGVERNLVQKVVVEVLPVGDSAPGGAGGSSPPWRSRIGNLRSRLSGNSVLVEGYLCGA